MRRSLILVLGLFFAGTLAHGGDANKDDLKLLQGEWKFVERVIDGKKGELEGTWKIVGNEIIYGPDSKVKAVFKIDATKKPKTFDFDHVSKDPKQEQKGILGIYEVDGDTFRLCVVIPGKEVESPKAFESKEGSGHTYTLLKRVKDKEK